MRPPNPDARRTVRGLVAVAAALLGAGLGTGCGDPHGDEEAGAPAPTSPDAPLRHVVLSGTDTEIGRGLARAFRAEIRARARAPLPEGLRASLSLYVERARPLAPAALLEELDAAAEEAGVSAAELYLREAAREGLRWHGAAGPVRAAAFASAPGGRADVALAFAEADPYELVVVERRPRDRPATLVLARAGEIGALAGVSEGGLVVVGDEIDLPTEARSLNAAPASWALRAALERATTADDAVARFAPSGGHRVLAADGANRRALRVVSLRGESPTSSGEADWVVASSGSGDAGDPLASAMDARISGAARALDAGEAERVAAAGVPADALGARVRVTTSAIRVARRPGAAPSEIGWATGHPSGAGSGPPR